MNFKMETALIEAVLFMETEPVDPANLAKATQLSKDVVMEALTRLKEKYESDEHGIELVELGGGYMLSPKKELWDQLKDKYGKKNDNRLSRAAMETLSIIAYSQPITRAEIEAIRGVAADGMMKILQARNLIKEVGKKEAPGRPIQFGTTKEFLKLFRLSSIADLPKMDEEDQKRFELNG